MNTNYVYICSFISFGVINCAFSNLVRFSWNGWYYISKLIVKQYLHFVTSYACAILLLKLLFFFTNIVLLPSHHVDEKWNRARDITSFFFLHPYFFVHSMKVSIVSKLYVLSLLIFMTEKYHCTWKLSSQKNYIETNLYCLQVNDMWFSKVVHFINSSMLSKNNSLNFLSYVLSSFIIICFFASVHCWVIFVIPTILIKSSD